MVCPIKKYINKPNMSFIVVINGPVATAGSILYFCKESGIKVPNRAANTITAIREILTVILNIELYPNRYVETNIIIPHIIPFNNPMANSLINLCVIFSVFSELFANPCTTIAAD